MNYCSDVVFENGLSICIQHHDPWVYVFGVIGLVLFAVTIYLGAKLMADISKLTASVATLVADVSTLIAKPTVPTQADLDAVQATVDAADVTVKAAIAQP
jgi:hypothetical protein